MGPRVGAAGRVPGAGMWMGGRLLDMQGFGRSCGAAPPWHGSGGIESLTALAKPAMDWLPLPHPYMRVLMFIIG